MNLLRTLLALLVASLAFAQDEPPSGVATLRGRFLLPDGQPAAGVTLAVMGWGANQERKLEFGEPKQWVNPSGSSDDEGRFALRFLPPQAYQFVFDGNLPGYAEASWRWGRIQLGETVDVGDVTLVAAGVITGRVVDSKGNVQSLGWRVSAETEWRGLTGGRDSTRVGGEPDPKTGEFRIEGVPAGKVEVSARAGGGVNTNTVEVEVVAGGEVFVELVYDGPDLSRRITVVHFSRPFYIFRPHPTSISLIGPDGKRTVGYHIQGSSQATGFDDLPDGEYRVEIDDPLYEPWSKDGVRPGERVDAVLKGGATLELEVVAAESGRPLLAYEARVIFHRSNSSPNEFTLLERTSQRPASTIVEGMIPTTFQVVVLAPGRPRTVVEVPALSRGEVRSVRVEVHRAVEVVGRVVDAAGEPLEGVRIEWTMGDKAGYPGPGSQMTSEGPSTKVQQVVTSSADGNFRLEGAGPGKHTLRAVFSPWLMVDQTFTIPDDGVPVLARPQHGWLIGRVIVPDGVDPATLMLNHVDPNGEISRGSGSMAHVEVEADGSFCFGPLPVGKLQVLFLTTHQQDRGSWLYPHPLTTTTIIDGKTSTGEWDLRDRWPGSVTVTLRANGEALPQVLIGTAPPGEDTTRMDSLPPGGGTIVLRGVLPGESVVLVRAIDGAWEYRSPTSFTLASAGSLSIEVEVPLITREVRFVDGEGQPLMNAEVTWKAGGSRPSKRTTDETGALTLTFPEGEVGFATAKSGLRASAEGTVTWSSGEGPLIVTLD